MVERALGGPIARQGLAYPNRCETARANPQPIGACFAAIPGHLDGVGAGCRGGVVNEGAIGSVAKVVAPEVVVGCHFPAVGVEQRQDGVGQRIQQDFDAIVRVGLEGHREAVECSAIGEIARQGLACPNGCGRDRVGLQPIGAAIPGHLDGVDTGCRSGVVDEGGVGTVSKVVAGCRLPAVGREQCQHSEVP